MEQYEEPKIVIEEPIIVPASNPSNSIFARIKEAQGIKSNVIRVSNTMSALDHRSKQKNMNTFRLSTQTFADSTDYLDNSKSKNLAQIRKGLASQANPQRTKMHSVCR